MNDSTEGGAGMGYTVRDISRFGPDAQRQILDALRQSQHGGPVAASASGGAKENLRKAAGSRRERVRNVSTTPGVSPHPPGEKRVPGDSAAFPEEIQFSIQLNPVTKKNSQRIIKCGSYHRIMPSKAYVQYERDARQFLPHRGEKIRRQCEIVGLFYMKTRRKVDLTNLLEALDDILVAHGVIEDDNSRIIVSHDGSRVLHDPIHPRTEVTIRFLEQEEISLFDTE